MELNNVLTGFPILIKALYLKCLHDMCFTGLRLSNFTTHVTLAVLLHNDPHNTAYLSSSASVIKCYS